MHPFFLDNPQQLILFVKLAILSCPILPLLSSHFLPFPAFYFSFQSFLALFPPLSIISSVVLYSWCGPPSPLIKGLYTFFRNTRFIIDLKKKWSGVKYGVVIGVFVLKLSHFVLIRNVTVLFRNGTT